MFDAKAIHRRRALLTGIAVGTAITGLWACTHTHEPHDDQPDEGANVPVDGLTQTSQALSAQLHNESHIVVAHDHIITTDEFEQLRDGGASVVGLDIVAGDGQEHVNFCRRPRTPEQMPGIWNANRSTLDAAIATNPNRYEIATSAEALRSAKGANKLAIVVGSESIDHVVAYDGGGPSSRPSVSQVRQGVGARVNEGWRKTSIDYPAVFADPPNSVDGNGVLCTSTGPMGGNGSSDLYWMNVGGGPQLTEQGAALIAELNRTGVLIDLVHANAIKISNILDGVTTSFTDSSRTSAPVFISHDYAAYLSSSQSLYAKVAASGGGYGVVAFNFLVDPAAPNVQVLAEKILELSDALNSAAGEPAGSDYGSEHIALGPDYYNGQYPFVVGPAGLAALTNRLVAVGFSATQIKNILGESMLTLYERAWNPTRNRSGGLARFYTCTNSSTSPECRAVRSRRGQGDFNHRPVSCLNTTPGAVSLALNYYNGAWYSWSVGPWPYRVPCTDGSLLAVTWDDGLPSQEYDAGGFVPNGEFELCTNQSTSLTCVGAASSGGSGTPSARVVNCLGLPGVNPGPIGLHVQFSSSKWRFYNLSAQLFDCAGGSALAARWGSGVTATARVQLCDDESSDATAPVAKQNAICVAAAQADGNGSGTTRALSCLNSTPATNAHSTVGLQVTYRNGRWMYWTTSATLEPCVHGSVLVARP